MTEGSRKETEHHFRAVLGHFASGVAVVTAIDAGEPVGLTIQSFTSLSLEPPLILLCPALSSTSWPRVAATGVCCVNLLAEDQAELARQFSRPGIDKYSGVGWTPAPDTGSPVLDGALAWIDCRIERTTPGGDHLVAICHVLSLAADVERRPLVFFKSGFRQML